MNPSHSLSQTVAACDSLAQARMPQGSRVLLHMCCGPCSLMPVQRLREQGLELTGLFYNPNIHPLMEYLRRREAAVLTAERLELPLIWPAAYAGATASANSDNAQASAPELVPEPATELATEPAPEPAPEQAYDVAAWLAGVNDPAQVPDLRGADRCAWCYRTRLDVVARMAVTLGFAAFSTSLLYSCMQRHELIRAEGEAAGARHGVPFLYHDFRPDWDAGIELSKAWELYRQNYCGCIYSEAERFDSKLHKALRRAARAGAQH